MSYRRPSPATSGARLQAWTVVVLVLQSVACASLFAPDRPADRPLPADLSPATRVPATLDEARSKTDDGLVRVKAPELAGDVYVKPPRPRLQAYNKMMLLDSVLTYRKGVKGWDSRTEDELKAYLRERLELEVYDGETWERSEVPGDGVLLLHAGAMDLNVDVSGTPPGSNKVYRSGGDVVLVIDLRDSVTNEPLLRFFQKRELSAGSFSGWDIESRRLRATMDVFAEDLGTMLERFAQASEQIEADEAGR